MQNVQYALCSLKKYVCEVFWCTLLENINILVSSSVGSSAFMGTWKIDINQG